MDETERLDLLHRAIDELAALLGDPQEVLNRLAHLAVPAIADACWIDVVRSEAEMQRLAQVGPARLADPLVLDHRFDLDKAPLIAAVVRSSQRLVLTDLRADPTDDPTLAGMAIATAAHTHLGVLLCKGTRVLGAMSLLYLAPGRSPGDQELGAADDLASLGELAVLTSIRTQRLRRLKDSSAVMSRTLTRAEVSQAVLSELTEAAEAASVTLSEPAVDQPGGVSTISALAHGISSEDSSDQGLWEAVVAEVMETGRPVSFSSAEERRERRPDLPDVGYAGPGGPCAAVAAIPIRWGSETRAVVVFAYSQPRMLDADEMDYLGELAAQCALALERADAYEAQAALTRRLRVLAATGEALEGGLDVTSTVQRTASILAHELGDWCAIHLRSAAELDLVALSHRDPRRQARLRRLSELFRARLTDARGPGVVIRENIVDTFEELAGEMAPIYASATEDELDALSSLQLERCSGISAPLRRGDAAMGVLSVVWDRPKAWGLEEIALVQDVARRVSLVLAAAWEIEDRRMIEANLAAIASQATRLGLLTSRLSEALTVEEVGSCVLVDSLESLGATGGALSLITPSGDYRLVRMEGHGGQTGVDWPASRVRAPSLLELALRTRRPVVLSTPEALRAAIPRPEAEALIALAPGAVWMTLPLISGSFPLGALVLTFPAGHRFDGAEQDHLWAVAAQVTSALDRVLRYQLEHQVAETLQRALLSRSLPNVDGLTVAGLYLPGSDGVLVGGDWYDVLSLPGGRVALVVGDVAGHDLHAAGVMGHTKAQLQACLYEHSSPARALDALDALLGLNGDDEIATVACAVWDPERHSLIVALAGHPPPILVQAELDGGAVSARFVGPPPGMPCGAGMGERRYEEVTVDLAPDACLLAYTDGLVEARDQPLDERLEALRRAVETRLCPPGPGRYDPSRSGAGRQGDLEALAKAIASDLQGERERRDDVVALAAHLVRQVRSPPAPEGPNA